MDGWKPLFYAAVNNNMGFESLSKVPNRQTDKGTRFDFFFLVLSFLLAFASAGRLFQIGGLDLDAFLLLYKI